MESEPAGLTCGDWARALVDVLLPERTDGRPVVLACDDDALARAGLALGVESGAADALAGTVRRAGGLAAAARAVRAFERRAPRRAAPEHLAALALLVLAAARMGDEEFDTRVYYLRLAGLLGPYDRLGHPPYEGFAEVCERGLAALDDWLHRDEDGARGELSLPTDPWPRLVGLPVSQVALREVDRRHLPQFFAERRRQLDAGWDPAGTLAHHPVRHRLTKPAQALLRDPWRRPLLSAALRAARAAWDGESYTADGRRVMPSLLLAELDPLGGGLALRLVVEGIDAALAGHGPDGERIELLPPPVALTVPHHWLAHAGHGPVRVECDGGVAVDALVGPLILFEAGPLGLQQVAAAADGRVWVLTCEPLEAGERVACVLPEPWRLLAEVDPAALPEAVRGPDPEGPRFAHALQPVGGLPLGRGAWYSACPPRIAAPPEVEGELTVDGRPAGRLIAGRELEIPSLRGHDGPVAVEVAGHRCELLLVARGTRDGQGRLSWRLDAPARAAAGPVADIPPEVALTVSGALVRGPATELELPAPRGPSCRLSGTVVALGADGRRRLVRPPEPEQWERAVGCGSGSRWCLPARTVWACQPQHGSVRLVDPTREVDPRGPDVAEVVAACEGARVVGPPAAVRAWQRLIDAFGAACELQEDLVDA